MEIDEHVNDIEMEAGKSTLHGIVEYKYPEK